MSLSVAFVVEVTAQCTRRPADPYIAGQHTSHDDYRKTYQ